MYEEKKNIVSRYADEISAKIINAKKQNDMKTLHEIYDDMEYEVYEELSDEASDILDHFIFDEVSKNIVAAHDSGDWMFLMEICDSPEMSLEVYDRLSTAAKNVLNSIMFGKCC